MNIKCYYLILAILIILSFGCNHYFVTCLDGNKVLVHKNPEKAYPLIARDYNLVFKNTINLNSTLLDSFNLEYKNKIVELREKASQDVIETENMLKALYIMSNDHPCDTAVRNSYLQATKEISLKILELRKINQEQEKITKDKSMLKSVKQIKYDSLLRKVNEVTSNKKLITYKVREALSESNNPDLEIYFTYLNSETIPSSASKYGFEIKEGNVYLDSNSIKISKITQVDYSISFNLYSTNLLSLNSLLITLKEPFNDGIKAQREINIEAIKNLLKPQIPLFGKYYFTINVKYLEKSKWYYLIIAFNSIELNPTRKSHLSLDIFTHE